MILFVSAPFSPSTQPFFMFFLIYLLHSFFMSLSDLHPSPRLHADEHLGKLATITPQTEDTYEFLENWPAGLAPSA